MNDSGVDSESSFYKHLAQDAFNTDIEQSAVDEAHLMNDTVKNFLWQGVTVTVKDHQTKQPKTILHRVDGLVEAGMSTLMIKLKHISSPS